MFKQLLVPVQKWLLNHNQCVGCGRPLKMGRTAEKKGHTLVFCKCGRIYIKQDDKYRRALFEEV
jgi:hypothetical protein